MDSDIMEWVSQRPKVMLYCVEYKFTDVSLSFRSPSFSSSIPQDWWSVENSKVYTWGKGSWNQLGQASRDKTLPDVASDWKDVLQV